MQGTEERKRSLLVRVLRWPFALLRRLYDWVLHWAKTPYAVPALALLAFTESAFFPVPPDVLLIALAVSIPKKAFRYALICSIFSVLGGCFGYLIGFGLWEPVGRPVMMGLHQLKSGAEVGAVAPGSEAERAGVMAGDLIVALNGERVKDANALLARLGTLPSGAEVQVSVTGSAGEKAFSTRTAAPGDGDGLLASFEQTPFGLKLKLQNFEVIRALYASKEYDMWLVALAGFTPIPYKVFTIAGGLCRIGFGRFVVASALSRSARFFLVSLLIFFFGKPVRDWIEKYFNWATLLFMVALIGGFVAMKYWLGPLMERALH